MQTMGTGFETWAASHIVEGNNKTLVTPELVQFLNTHFFFGVSESILLQADSKKTGTRIKKKCVNKHS